MEIRRSWLVWELEYSGVDVFAFSVTWSAVCSIIAQHVLTALYGPALHGTDTLSHHTHSLQSVSEEDDQVPELIHTERLIVKRASGRAIVNK